MRFLRALAGTAIALGLVPGCGAGSGGPGARPATASPAVSSTSTGPPSSSAAPSSPTPTTSGPTDSDPVSIDRYRADFAVTGAGDLEAVERLTLDVPVDDRHGIYRTFTGDAVVRGFRARLDGRSTPTRQSRVGGDLAYRIGDPRRTLSVGLHAVRIDYRVAGVVGTTASGMRQLDWQLIPAGWALDIHAARLTVDLPSPASDARCTVGESRPCSVRGVGTTTLVVRVADLPSRTPVRLLATWSDGPGGPSTTGNV